MNPTDWRWLQGLKTLLATQEPEPARQAERIVAMQLHVVLPAKAGVVAVVLYYLFYSGWLQEQASEPPSAHWIAVEMLQRYFTIYVSCNVLVAAFFILRHRFPPGLFQWIVFTLGILDGLFVSGLTFITGGFDSIGYWLFPGLIVLNAISIPLASPQLGLNLMLSLFYLGAGLLYVNVPVLEYSTLPAEYLRPSMTPGSTNRRTGEMGTNDFRISGVQTNLTTTNRVARPGRRALDLVYSTYPQDDTESPADPVLPRLFVLWLLTACCYGVQVLAERQRRVFEEERESAVREAQLHSAGRLAAEFAHQIKNPLAIINNAVFSVRRAMKEGRPDISRQIEIIQEEVERSDRIVTQIMGYAQLNEGRVEKLSVAEELDAAIDEVFPPGVDSGIQVERSYVVNFPPLLMQRRHFRDVMVNLLQNAREAVGNSGFVTVGALCRPDSSLEVSVRDNGPGVPPDKVEKVFEAYYSSKEKGTGLGLAIVKHNVELYAGTVRVESELGKGARFVLSFPAKTVINEPT